MRSVRIDMTKLVADPSRLTSSPIVATSAKSSRLAAPFAQLLAGNDIVWAN